MFKFCALLTLSDLYSQTALEVFFHKLFHKETVNSFNDTVCVTLSISSLVYIWILFLFLALFLFSSHLSLSTLLFQRAFPNLFSLRSLSAGSSHSSSVSREHFSARMGQNLSRQEELHQTSSLWPTFLSG